MPIISNPETELDMNSALLFADFYVWQDWNTFHLFCSVMSINKEGAILPYLNPFPYSF